MSVKVLGTEQRLALELPAEGQTWVREGDRMKGAAASGGSAPNSQDQFLPAPNGAVDPTKAHTDLEGDALDPSSWTLAAGTTDGFTKTIRLNANAGGGSEVVVTPGLRVAAGNGPQPNVINFPAVGDGCMLMWQAASGKWVVRLLTGTANLTSNT